MITVKFLGGAKKSFSAEQLSVDKSDITLDALLNYLISIKPKDTPTFDFQNTLIAINGVDSSSIDGNMTVLKNNDTVSIIPIIHGGSSNRIFLTVLKKTVQIMEIKGSKKIDVSFIDEMRKSFPKLTIQAISSEFVLNKSHAEKILFLSLTSQKNKNLLSNKLETDILMRFALTSQISDAIKLAGIKPRKNFILITIGNKKQLESLYQTLDEYTVNLFSKDYSLSLKKQFNFNKKQLDSILSKTPLEDLLLEKAAILL